MRKGIEMKRFLAFVLIAALGVVTIGCESDKGTTQNKTETKDNADQGRQDNGRGDDTTTDTMKTTPLLPPPAA